jgi:hypothetical protein
MAINSTFGLDFVCAQAAIESNKKAATVPLRILVCVMVFKD